MSDVAPPPAWMVQPADMELPQRRVHVAREAAFQEVAVAFIDRVLIKPCWRTATLHENELTDNARARAKKRGVEPGVHDLYVCQAPGRSVWLELKWGANQPSADQKTVHGALYRCDIPCAYCWSIRQVLVGLRDAGMQLHANADNLAVEFEHRAMANVMRAEQRAHKAPSSRPQHGRRAPPGQIQRARKAGVLV